MIEIYSYLNGKCKYYIYHEFLQIIVDISSMRYSGLLPNVTFQIFMWKASKKCIINVLLTLTIQIRVNINHYLHIFTEHLLLTKFYKLQNFPQRIVKDLLQLTDCIKKDRIETSKISLRL